MSDAESIGAGVGMVVGLAIAIGLERTIWIEESDGTLFCRMWLVAMVVTFVGVAIGGII